MPLTASALHWAFFWLALFGGVRLPELWVVFIISLFIN